MLRRIGGGILAAVSVAVPTVIRMGNIHISEATAHAVLIACAVAFLIGLVLVFWPMSNRDKTDGASKRGGSVGIFIAPTASRNKFRDTKIGGFDTAIEDHGQETTFERTSIAGPSSKNPPNEKPKRRYFSGFRFGKK